MISLTVPIPPLRHRAGLQPKMLRAFDVTRTPLAVVCAILALLLFAGPAAQAHIFPVRGANVCFAERIGDNLEPAWNVPIDGVDEALPVADPESTGPISIHFDEALTETTKAIGDDYFDWLDVYVSGLSLGQTVVIERFLVDNDQGIVNPGAVLMESHRMQDGYLPLTGDIPNLSSVEDWDGERDGKIWTQLGMFGGIANMPGESVIRVSSPLDSFPPTTARLRINEVPTDQFFFGEVVDNLGKPIPGAFVALLEPLGNYSEILFAAQADEDGNYLLYAPYPDEVDVVAVAPGYVGPFQQGASQVIEEIPWNITAVDAERVIPLGGEFSIKDPLDAGHEEVVTGQPGLLPLEESRVNSSECEQAETV